MIRNAVSWLTSRSRLALVAGLVGAAALAVTTTGSLGGFTASITNTGDSAQTGSLLMKEDVTPSGGTVSTCLSTTSGTISGNANAACLSNKFGALANAIPGATSSSNVVVTNQGSVSAQSFTIGAATCSAVGTAGPGAVATNVGSDTAGFCGKVDITIQDNTTVGSPKCIYPAGTGACPAASNTYTLSTLSTFAPVGTPTSLGGTVAAGAARTYLFTVTMDSSMTNADQAMAATQPITFTFGS